jgi:hypothetical protein
MEPVKRCPHCAEEILAAAVKCKHCGSKIKRPLTAAQMIVILGAVILFAWYGWFSDSSSTTVAPYVPPPSPPTPVAEEPVSAPEPTHDLPSLSVKANMNGELISIKNTDGFAWQDCVAIINPPLFSFSKFRLKFGDLKAGHSTMVAASDFTKSDGERFNPITHEVQSLFITCTTPQGQQSWMRSSPQ